MNKSILFFMPSLMVAIIMTTVELRGLSYPVWIDVIAWSIIAISMIAGVVQGRREKNRIK